MKHTADLKRQILDILSAELSAGVAAIEGEENAADRIAELFIRELKRSDHADNADLAREDEIEKFHS